MLEAEANTAREKLPTIVDLDDLEFDPFVGDELSFGDTLNPYERIHELAREKWVHECEYRRIFSDYPNAALEKYGFKYYTVFGYDKCAEMIPNFEVFSNRPLALTIGTSFGKTISGMDPPEHTRYRRIFQKAFLPQTVRKWGEALVDPVVTGLLDKVMDRGHCDLVADFTFHYPFQVIYRQLDLPPEDIRVFHKLAISQTSFYYAPDKAIEAGEKLGAYFSNMVQARRELPGDDLVSALALAEVDGEQLPEDVVVSFLRQLTNAGGDTTYRGTSILLTALLTHPEQLEAVRQDRSLVSAAIEESLRWDGPVMTAERMTTRDFAIDGFTFPKNSVVSIVQGSANRDPTKFADPDKFDIFRDRTYRHLAFTTGPHVCIGQHLARVEMERALNAILDRLPALRLDPDMPGPEIRGFNLRTPQHLHVRFD
jgi:cytochrome P450